MSDRFFKQPILNSPYERPNLHWELDDDGQPTQNIVEKRRRADFITPIPKAKGRKAPDQREITFDEGRGLSSEEQIDLFADFNGVPEGEARTEFYEHEANWTNRMILGDSLQVMASLAEREGLRGQVQCIYLDPPYGIKFNSNFQWSTTTRTVKDGKAEHITREPEQVKAFRDTWRDGIHSYLTYLRDRLTACRDLLKDSGSIFVQIGDENVHRVRALMDEVFGESNFIITISFQKKAYQDASSLAPVNDYILWAAKNKSDLKYRPLYVPTPFEGDVGKYNRIEAPDFRVESSKSKEPEELKTLLSKGWQLLREDYPVVSQDPPSSPQPFVFQGVEYEPTRGRHWSQKWPEGMERLAIAGRLRGTDSKLYAREYWKDSAVVPRNNLWTNLKGPADPTYVVETSDEVVKRCLLMSTDPGDLVLDPTCGSGTTAYAAEKWGRRWITIDTSRVALTLARARLMGARYPFYLLKDSQEGHIKAAEIERRSIREEVTTGGSIRQGFVYKRIPRISLGDISQNAEIDVIYKRFQEEMEPIRQRINEITGLDLEDWQIHRELGNPWPKKAQKQHKRFMRVTTDATRQKAVNRVNEIMGRDYTIDTFPDTPVDDWEDKELIDLHERWWELRIERQKEIDASIAAAADFEYLYDRPYKDKNKVRVAGPFTVESLSPHRTLNVDENGDIIDHVAEARKEYGGQDFPSLILDALRKSGVQQMHKEDRIELEAVVTWPGTYVCATGKYTEQRTGTEKRAGIFIGPEFGSVTRPNLVAAAREAADAGLDTLIACAFSYDAHASEFEKLGRVNVLKARMNADLHMAGDLANTGNGNLFVIFGEPDIDILDADDDQIKVKINGVDVFDPSSGEVRSDDTDGIACWFIDTDYNEESFFVRHAYFLGAGDPYKSLKTTLKAEIDEAAWDSLYSEVSRPFSPPESGRIAVKVINHLGDEVMQVFKVER